MMDAYGSTVDTTTVLLHYLASLRRLKKKSEDVNLMHLSLAVPRPCAADSSMILHSFSSMSDTSKVSINSDFLFRR
jgi:hypothetical protein